MYLVSIFPGKEGINQQQNQDWTLFRELRKV